MTQYFIWLLESFILLHTGTFIVRIKAAMKAGFLLSPVAAVIYDLHIWFTDNADYVNFVAVAIAADYILGTWKHALVDRDFNARKNITGLLTKVALILLVGVLFEGITVIVTAESIVKVYLEIVARLIVFLYPAGSAMGNSSVLSGGVFPPEGWIKRLNKFKENANPNVFTEEYIVKKGSSKNMDIPFGGEGGGADCSGGDC